MGKINSNIFQRNVPGSTEKLQKATVGIAGCGGLGSNSAVALVRAGVGKLIIVDFDNVEESNLNRQYFFQYDIGKIKVDALAEHLKNINPNVTLVIHHTKLEPNNIKQLFKDADMLIEAFDKAEEKHWLIESWCKNFPHKPIICASGLSGLGKTEQLKVKHAGQIYICGDEESDMKIGLCSARVAIVANMQANVAIEILTSSKEK